MAQNIVKHLSITGRVLAITGCATALSSVPIFIFAPLEILEKVAIAIGICVLSIGFAKYLLRDIKEGLAALETGLLNLKDGEYSTSLAYQKQDELGHLCALYNDTVQQMRDEKHGLYQRELLLDKVTQSSPEALFLVNAQGQVVFSNIASRRFFNTTSSLDGEYLHELSKDAPLGVEEVLLAQKEGLFSLTKTSDLEQTSQEAETWHMSIGHFNLNNQSHVLYILKQMTRELSRQEVAVWKKVIRVISHELNNSLGPISSMLHSGKIVSQQFNEERLTRVFATIEERIKHLSEFVQGYGKFAKLPEPKISQVDWQSLLKDLSQQWDFVYDKGQKASVYADPVQLEQLLINLLKNAHESGSEVGDIAIQLDNLQSGICIKVTDGGKGMSHAVMQSALIPFYSTKASGSGLGLALCREIVDAHHGHLALHNQESGGLMVKVSLPDFSQKALTSPL